jgi:hypothetical protein
VFITRIKVQATAQLRELVEGQRFHLHADSHERIRARPNQVLQDRDTVVARPSAMSPAAR